MRSARSRRRARNERSIWRIVSRGLLAFFAIVSVARAASPPRSIPELETRIAATLEARGVPGAALAIALSPDELWVAGVGAADRETSEAMTADHAVRVGSISKMVVALSVLHFAELGALDLGAPLRSFGLDLEWSNRWDATDPVTLEQLLEHTTGFDDIHLAEYAYDGDPRAPLRETLAYHPDSRISRWRPGTRHAYTNSGPAIAAHVVERIAGRSFEVVAARLLFEPLGMSATTFYEPSGLRATGYLANGSVGDYWHVLYRPSGALNSTARDMGALLRLFLGRGTFDDRRIVRTESIARMERAQTSDAARAGAEAGYGLANDARFCNGFAFRGHAGGVQTFLSDFGYSPSLGRGYFFSINRSDPAAFREIRRLLCGLLVSDRGGPLEPAVAVVPLEGYAGYYRPVAPRVGRLSGPLAWFGTLRLRATDGGLVARPLLGGSETTLVPVDERRFREAGHPVATSVFVDRTGESEGGLELHGTEGALRGVHRRIGAATAWSLALLPIVGSLVLASEWLVVAAAFVRRRRRSASSPDPRRLGRAPDALGRPLRLASTVLLGASIGCLVGGFRDPLERLGEPTFWSIGFAFGSMAFVAVATAALARSWYERDRLEVVPWGYGLACASAACAIAGVLWHWGLLGLCTWSY